MVNKISNTNKNHIHIHIGDKKKKHHRRKSSKHGKSHGGTYISNHIAPVIPLYNRPQTLDTTLGDAREKERIRIQRGEFLPQTPTNAGSTFASGIPTNDDLNFLRRLRKGYEDKYVPKPPARTGPFSSPPAVPKTENVTYADKPFRKNVEETEKDFSHKKSRPYSPDSVAGGGPVGPPRVEKETNQPKNEPQVPLFSQQIPTTTSSTNIQHSDPVPRNTESMNVEESPEPNRPTRPFVSKVAFWNTAAPIQQYAPPPIRRDGPFTSQPRSAGGPFTSETTVRRDKLHKQVFGDSVSDAKKKKSS